MNFGWENVGDFLVHVFFNLDFFVCRSSLNNLIRGVPYLLRCATCFVTLFAFRDRQVMMVMVMVTLILQKQVTRRDGNAVIRAWDFRRDGAAQIGGIRRDGIAQTMCG